MRHPFWQQLITLALPTVMLAWPGEVLQPAWISTATAKTRIEAEPKVPPGVSPGGIAVALLGPGIDYRLEGLKAHLARDGEGELIAWDFSDNDIRPFSKIKQGSKDAKLIARLAPEAQIVVVKEKHGDFKAFGNMMSFAARTPARIIVWADAHTKRADWPILAEAVKRFRNHLFIVPAGIGGLDLDKDETFADLRGEPNLIVAAGSGPGTNTNFGVKTVDFAVLSASASVTHSPRNAALAIAAMAARILSNDPDLSAGLAKTRIIAFAATGLPSQPPARYGALLYKLVTEAPRIAGPSNAPANGSQKKAGKSKNAKN